MMKQFALKGLSVAVLAATSLGVAADTFSIEELPTADNYRSSFPQAMNEQGFVVGISRLPTNVDIDLSQVSAGVLANAGIEDIDAVEELTPEQYEYILTSLAADASNNFNQLQLGLHTAFLYDGITQSVPLLGDSVPNPTSNSYLYAINANNTAVGSVSGPFSTTDFTYTNSDDEDITRTFYVRDFVSRGVWARDGVTTMIEPPETASLGGESAIMDINNSGLAAGYASVAVSPFAQERIANCTPEDEGTIVTRPELACAQGIWVDLHNQTASNIAPTYYNRSNYSARRSIYDIRGFLWQLDNNGDVISSTELGTLEPRNEEDERDFSSYALAVNDNGIAVGQSWTYHPNRGAIRMPAIFQGTEALPVTENEDYYWGAATDINNNDVAIGYVVENRAGNLRNTAFTYDLDSSELTMLPGFFSGSSTVANAINNNGIIVGSGEIEATLQTVRRRVGFWYDTTAETPEFIDLNETISCDSPYYIVDANAVTDSGEVLATALKEEEYVDGDGETQTREVTVTLKMTPQDGELNNCREEANKIERSGASVGFGSLSLFALLGGFITGMRRKFGKNIKKS